MGRPLSAEYSLEMGFSFNTRLAKNLLYFKNATIKQDFDTPIAVDGGEGAGKSVHVQQVAAFMDIDHKLDLDTQIVWTPEDFKTAVKTIPKFKSIIWDEAGRGIARRRSMEDVNQQIIDMLRECRKRNLFLFIVMPTFYDMDMNVAVWRTRALIHVWYEWDVENPDRPLCRGFARFYNERGKKDLYTNRFLRQRYEYPFLRNKCFDYTFPHHYVVDEAAYRAKKDSAEEHYAKKEGDKTRYCLSCGSGELRFRASSADYLCRKCGWVGGANTNTHKKVEAV